MGGGGVGCKLPWVAYKPSYVVAWARHGACHACPLSHFINSARGQVTLYMMASRYSCLVRGMAVSSGSCRYRVRVQSAAGWLAQSAAGWSAQSAAGSRPGRAVRRGAGRSNRAVGLRGFASPDVLNYCLAVFGVSVANYSDSSPQASGQLGKVGRRFFGGCFMEMIMQKTKLVHADISNDCF